MKTIIFYSIIGVIIPLGFHSKNSKQNISASVMRRGNAMLCVYRLTYQPDSSSKTVKIEYLKLISSNGVSKFQSQNSSSRDSLTSLIVMQHQLQGGTNSMLIKQLYAIPFTDFRYIIYKGLSTDKMNCYDWIGGKLYRFEERIPLFTWTLTSSTSTIAGYKCQRAITSFAGRKYEAWFTREIPISDGPYKFCGLPGLIIKVHDVRNQYTFELVKLSRLAGPVDVNLPTKPASTTTKAQLYKGQQAYNLNVLNQAAAMGNNISAADQQAHKERLKKRNNPLELK